MLRISGLLIGTALAVSTPTFAETEDGLYGAAVPNDAVFLRRLGSAEIPTSLFGRSFSSAELPEATYVAISAAALTGAEPGGHYTVIDAAILQEPARTDRSKVYLFLLNSSP